MKTNYIIQWKSKINGRAGRGTRKFDREEAERLAAELNQEYPQILHEVVNVADLPARVGVQETDRVAA